MSGRETFGATLWSLPGAPHPDTTRKPTGLPCWSPFQFAYVIIPFHRCRRPSYVFLISRDCWALSEDDRKVPVFVTGDDYCPFLRENCVGVVWGGWGGWGGWGEGCWRILHMTDLSSPLHPMPPWGAESASHVICHHSRTLSAGTYISDDLFVNYTWETKSARLSDSRAWETRSGNFSSKLDTGTW